MWNMCVFTWRYTPKVSSILISSILISWGSLGCSSRCICLTGNRWCELFVVLTKATALSHYVVTYFVTISTPPRFPGRLRGSLGNTDSITIVVWRPWRMAKIVDITIGRVAVVRNLIVAETNTVCPTNFAQSLLLLPRHVHCRGDCRLRCTAKLIEGKHESWSSRFSFCSQCIGGATHVAARA